MKTTKEVIAGVGGQGIYQKGDPMSRPRKNCRYYAACGSGDNCRGCRGYAPPLDETWAGGARDRRDGFPARSANGRYIDGYYGIRRAH